MAEEPNQIKRHIDATRRELGENVHELGSRVKQATDWHTYFDKSPMTMIGLAFVGGVALSALVGRPGSHRNGHYVSTQPDAGQTHRALEQRKSEAVDMFDNVKGAIIGWTANQFKSLLNELLPGFRQEYERTESARKSYSGSQNPQHHPLA
jgi:hypothetical protein